MDLRQVAYLQVQLDRMHDAMEQAKQDRDDSSKRYQDLRDSYNFLKGQISLAKGDES